MSGIQESVLSLTQAMEYLRGFMAEGEGAVADEEMLNDCIITLENCRAQGLAAEDIEAILKIVIKTNMKVAKKAKLIHCMIPNAWLPEGIILDALTWYVIKGSAIPVTVVKALLQWSIGILEHGLVRNITEVARMQPLLFLTLDQNPSYIPLLCHLLHLLTMAMDVTRWQVTHLIHLRKVMGNPKSIQYLLNSYKMMRPNMVPLDIDTKATVSSLGRIPPQLVEFLSAASTRLAMVKGPVESRSETFTFGLGDDQTCPPVAKRRKEAVIIPRPEYIPLLSVDDGKTALFQFQSIAEALTTFPSVNFPSQVASLLQSRLGQFILANHPDKTYLCRFNTWIESNLIFRYCEVRDDGKNLQKIKFLDELIAFQESIEQCIPAVFSFLRAFLPGHVGVAYFVQVLQLTQWLPLLDFSVLYEDVLRHLEKIYQGVPIPVKCTMLISLTTTLVNMVKVGLQRSLGNEESLFPVPQVENPKNTISMMAGFIDHLIKRSTQKRSDVVMMQCISADFYKTLGQLQQEYGFYGVISLPQSLLYGTLMSPSAFVLDKVCQLLPLYKNLLQKAGKEVSQTQDWKLKEKRKVALMVYNEFTSDFCCMLTGNMQFTGNKHSILAGLTSQELQPLKELTNPECVMSLCNHTAFIGLGHFLAERKKSHWSKVKLQEKFMLAMEKWYPYIVGFLKDHAKNLLPPNEVIR